MVIIGSSRCLACLRRLAQPFANTRSTNVVPTWSQTRAKSKTLRPQDLGVIVRLLKDIPKFGRKDAIFRVERGRMRNEWYPCKKAEYMTPARFHELGITRADIGERDRGFVSLADEVVLAKEQEPEPEPVEFSEPSIQPDVERIHNLLTTRIPNTLTFIRKPIPTSPSSQPTKISPLVAPSQSASPATVATSEPVGIFGSVSTTDIVNYIRGILSSEPDTAYFSLEPADIHFLGLEDGVDRLKALGRWEVEISVSGSALGQGDSPREAVRKVVEILPE